MPPRPRDDVREERITMDIVVDTYNEDERALGWYAYLEDTLVFPFLARCRTRRTISPLKIGDEVEVIDMAPADECIREMFVLIRWERDGLGVPLGQLEPLHADAQTQQAVEDWLYWVDRGYQF